MSPGPGETHIRIKFPDGTTEDEIIETGGYPRRGHVFLLKTARMSGVETRFRVTDFEWRAGKDHVFRVSLILELDPTDQLWKEIQRERKETEWSERKHGIAEKVHKALERATGPVGVSALAREVRAHRKVVQSILTQFEEDGVAKCEDRLWTYVPEQPERIA